MNDNAINQVIRHRPLLGKIVLLIGNDTAVLHNLVTCLAQKGADIALLCRQIPQETVGKIKESVQAYGQKLLLLDQAGQEAATSKQVVDTVITELGHLDVFIDLSAQKSLPAPSEQGDKWIHPVGLTQANWHIAGAALEKLTW